MTYEERMLAVGAERLPEFEGAWLVSVFHSWMATDCPDGTTIIVKPHHRELLESKDWSDCQWIHCTASAPKVTE